MPAGAEVTVPSPVPVLVTISELLRANAAFTVVSLVTVSMQAPVPTHEPLQPTNVDVPAAAAVKASVEPWSTVSVQVPGQLMPAGVEVTAPVPLPARLTVTAYRAVLNVAVTVVSAPSVTTHEVAVPLQPPPAQPANVAPTSGAAVRVTDVAAVAVRVQLVPQSIPAGTDVTRPVAVPAFATVSVTSDGVSTVTASMAPASMAGDATSPQPATATRTTSTSERQ